MLWILVKPVGPEETASRDVTDRVPHRCPLTVHVVAPDPPDVPYLCLNTNQSVVIFEHRWTVHECTISLRYHSTDCVCCYRRFLKIILSVQRVQSVQSNSWNVCSVQVSSAAVMLMEQLDLLAKEITIIYPFVYFDLFWMKNSCNFGVQIEIKFVK